MFQIQLAYTKTVETPPWTISEIVKAMKGLKSKKSRDPTHIANELFDPSVAGEDIKNAIVNLMNRIRSDLDYLKCLQLYNISSIYKQKGPIDQFAYRGIFRVQAIRNILELLMNCNVGSKKNEIFAKIYLTYEQY